MLRPFLLFEEAATEIPAGLRLLRTWKDGGAEAAVFLSRSDKDVYADAKRSENRIAGVIGRPRACSVTRSTSPSKKEFIVKTLREAGE